MPFKILHGIRSVNPTGGGPIEGLKQLAAANMLRGHSVEVMSLDRPSDPWVKSCPLTCHAMGPAWFNYGYSPRFVPWLRANRQNYDVVIVNGVWQYSSFGVWLALHGTPTPYFVFPHGMLDPWFKRTYPLKHLKKWFYLPWGDYRVLRDATAILFTCEEERRLARQSFWLYQGDEFVVNYGTARPTGDPELQRRLFLEKFPHLKDKRCLLFLGRVHVKKGPALLIRALAELLKNRKATDTRDVHLVMAGPNDHSYGREMAALVRSLGLEERVTWTGMVSGDLKWGAFHSADAFILPSHQENFGIAVVESLACGLPVLISNQINIWREINQDRAGFVETDDETGTTRLLERWLEVDRDEWQEMRSRACGSFERRFTVEQSAASLIKAIELFGLVSRE